MRIHFYSIHGLFRANDLEIGRDSDNGGQIIYVMELAKALSRSPQVTGVHLFTRQIRDENVANDYEQEVEVVNEKFDIRRIPCGGDTYLPKEQLWPHLDEFVSNAMSHITREKIAPDWIHSHYADAGYVGAEISALLNIPFAHSAHSLGKRKLKGLLRAGVPREQAMRRYQFKERFDAEEITLAKAEFVVTSTKQEIGFFDDYENARLSEYHCLPPGIDFERFHPYYEDLLPTSQRTETEKQVMVTAQERIDRFLTHPEKPPILAICRPNRTKNIEGLLRAYGEDHELQTLANLVIFAGIRGDIETMNPDEKETLTQILLLMDKYNLYGKLAIPKTHDSENEVPAIYRLAARRRGVFTNLALHEQFGLTLLEASACGLPTVATRNGGPAEIVPNVENGILVDPKDTAAIQTAFKKILFDTEGWRQRSDVGINRVRDIYNWDRHAIDYLKLVEPNLQASHGLGIKKQRQHPQAAPRLRQCDTMFVTDIDGTLLSETDPNQPGLERLRSILEDRGSEFIFAIASGRSLKLVREVFAQHSLPLPDIAIGSVGTEIFYGLESQYADKGWNSHISFRWDRDLIEARALTIEALELQEEPSQKPFKISFYTQTDQFNIETVYEALGELAQDVNVVITRGAYVDILPRRASKGKAIRYLCQKWGIPLARTVVAGDSGNDLDMFQIDARGIVVGNASDELSQVRDNPNAYFAQQPSAEGILEGFSKYDFPKLSNGAEAQPSA